MAYGFCWTTFFFNDTATTEIYTLSLHDALPIRDVDCIDDHIECYRRTLRDACRRRSARSEEHTSELHHSQTSYAVFCLKKKKTDASPARGIGARRSRRSAISTCSFSPVRFLTSHDPHSIFVYGLTYFFFFF